ncbi:head-tail adaptor [Mycobacterium phage MooMoo]|uniref:Head-to-tail connector complex protein n=1 Tax=Mycobacterium phage MooMoo TaxID=2108127 RepID=A0A2P1JR38_9CAUD|nr:head-tail adaptor [Mycobacterium phage MooMoo]AVO21616.1 head-to-tail connector complex protein [Mycobacterium phage MooMoo]
MTDLHDQVAPDTEDFVTCWMQPVMRTAVERDLGEVLPFCEVTLVDGSDDPDCGDDDSVVQLDFYGRGVQAARQAADVGHRRMLFLFRNFETVTLSDGSLADIDYGEVVMKPRRMQFADDKIVRYTGRYKLATSYVTVS